jgi:hypothetical protein
VAGLPLTWLARPLGMSPREFHDFAMFVVIAAMGLMYAIATSDSAP